jgi:hypothetical protein
MHHLIHIDRVGLVMMSVFRSGAEGHLPDIPCHDSRVANRIPAGRQRIVTAIWHAGGVNEKKAKPGGLTFFVVFKSGVARLATLPD